MNIKGILALGLVLAATAAHAGNQNMAGCGLGSMLFKENQPVHQIVAATTNGTFGNQTFGITTGTLGCGPGMIKNTSIQKQEDFVAVNFRELSREMAAGKGEYVSSLAGLLGCSEANIPAFGKFTQERYSALIPSQSMRPSAVLKAIKLELAKDATLSTGCSQL